MDTHEIGLISKQLEQAQELLETWEPLLKQEQDDFVLIEDTKHALGMCLLDKVIGRLRAFERAVLGDELVETVREEAARDR